MTVRHQRRHGQTLTGGDGAEVTGRLIVTPGQVLTAKVGGYGGDANDDRYPGDGGWGATGRGGRGGFYDSDHRGLGTADIVNGTAQLTVPAERIGVDSHLLHASYNGNEHWAANDSNQVNVTVQATQPAL